ncbi:MAG: AMP-binding protein [Campylobacterales bacterium]|nr:AMP-binding protein [Campylobacterales bacterium]
MNYKNLFDMFLKTCKQYNNELAFVYRVKNAEYKITYQKLYTDVLNLSSAFQDQGVKKDDKVMFVSDNRYEWILTDLALLSIGAISVPRGTDTPSQELEYIMTHSECKFLILETKKTFLEYEEMLKTLNIEKIFLIEKKENESYLTYKQIQKDINPTQKDIEYFDNLVNTHDGKDTFTIIYTSGTTGRPKGVILSHSNMLYNIEVVPEIIDLNKDDVWLSILPSWHVFERGVEYTAISHGCKIIYSSIKTFSQDLEYYKPTLVATVPRLWESMYSKINAKLSKDPKKASIFNKLVDISKAYRYNMRILKDQLPRFQEDTLKESICKKFVPLLKVISLYPLNLFAKKKLSLVQQKFGGKMKLAISGGGALPEYIDEWIDALGIRIVNSYGMTECAPSIAGRALNCDIFGTLGKPLRGTSLRIVNEAGKELKAGEVGSIQVKGPQVMSGYYNSEEETNKTFTDDGYLKTGDLGKLTISGELILTGRSKEIIVLANGENVDPSRIESAISIMPFINDTMLIGQDKKGLGLLIVADFDGLKEFVQKKFNKAIKSFECVMKDQHIVNDIKKELNELLQKKHGFKPFEKLQNIHFLEKEFKMGEELTNTLKKKRHIIEQKYKELIDKILK